MSINLSANQQHAMKLLNDRDIRDLYEGASTSGGRGCGYFWITHTANETYTSLDKREVNELLTLGLIVQKWPGCYTTPRNLAANPLYSMPTGFRP